VTWVSRTLESVCLNIVDCEHKTAPVDIDGEFFAVGTPAMRGHRINLGEARRISADTFTAWTRRMLPAEGDLLFAREAPVGPIVRIPKTANIAPGQRTVLLRPDPEQVDSNYLYYLFTSPLVQAKVQVKAEGSTVPHLNVADVRGFELPPLPSLPDQRAIAATLGALDDKIESNLRAAELAGNLLDAMAYGAAARLSTVPLGVIASLKKEIAKPELMGDIVVSHYSLPAFDGGKRPERTHASAIKSNKLWVRGRAILVSRLNPRTNRSWWVSSDDSVPSIASTEFAVLQAEHPMRLPGVWLAIRESNFQQELARRVTGTSGSHQRVRPDDMLDISVPDTRQLSTAELQRIESVLSLIEARRDESQRLAALRDTLLPELVSARIRLADVDVP